MLVEVRDLKKEVEKNILVNNDTSGVRQKSLLFYGALLFLELVTINFNCVKISCMNIL